MNTRKSLSGLYSVTTLIRKCQIINVSLPVTHNGGSCNLFTSKINQNANKICNFVINVL